MKTNPNAIMPRRDLRLEALTDILHGDLKVHAHSYRADEILMLIRVADEFGFKIHTFQHVLEGYKVADEMASTARWRRPSPTCGRTRSKRGTRFRTTWR